MIKAGVVIDSWKRPIFEKRLKDAGYTWKLCPGVTPDTLSFIVKTTSAKELEVVVRAANAEAAKSRAQ